MYVVNYLRKIGYIHKHSGTCRYPPHNFERFLTHHFAFFPLQYISLDLQCKCKGRDRHPWVTTVSPRREYFTATERESILCPRGRQDRILQNRLGEGWSLERIKGRESLEVSVTAMRQWPNGVSFPAGLPQQASRVVLRLRQVRGAGEHPGDLVHALLALDGPYEGLAVQ